MNFFVPVVDYPSGKPLVPPLSVEEFTRRILDGLARDPARMRGVVTGTARGVAFRGEIERVTEDRGDPRQAGWTYVIHQEDPRCDALIDALEPLARRRGMAEPRRPLLFDDRAPDEWNDWLEEQFATLAGRARPFYFLLVGGPDRLPFRLQAFLDVAAAVGRLDFDAIEDYGRYVSKVVRLETVDAPVSRREAVFFATDAGPADPTYYSLQYMARPLAAHAGDRLGFGVRTLFGPDATRGNLAGALGQAPAAVVYTASHGFAAFGQPDTVQREVNGAIQCHHPAGATADTFLFAARDVPLDQPFLEGAVFFQFACLGYGTPADSDFAHWFPEVPARHAGSDFVAALPRRLLAHPEGPIAFIGHLDLAFLQGFTDADAPDIVEPWHARLDPFADVLEKLLRVQPVGLAIERMNTRAANLSSAIVNSYDRLQRGRVADTPEFRMQLARAFVQLADARNYMVLGDPGARLRIADA